MSAFTLRAHAKINLTLETLGMRPDGYHELRSLMAKLALHDTLRFSPAPAGQLSLACAAPGLSLGEDNLVLKAARLLQAAAGRPLGARMLLIKRIPLAAGLAGGSADAAAALLGLNRLWRLRLSPRRLRALALRLGSDVPFCLDPCPAAVARGRGERLARVAGLPPLHLALVKPDISVSTAWVDKNLKLKALVQGAHTAKALAALRAGDLQALRQHGINHLESVSIPRYPVIARIKKKLNQNGALFSLMSGSGPTVYALFTRHSEAERATKFIKNERYFKCSTQFL
jgi:4-diphosphocytidyl-2-C-methyl-D-erythritol kinase